MTPNEIRRDHLSKEMYEYRNWLVKADKKASDAYDKAVMTLSGGALGLSLTFLRDIIKSPYPEGLWRLEAAWGCWTLSLTSILISMLSSQWALRKAINQVDQRSFSGGRAGGRHARLTEVLNVFAGLAFVVGVTLFAWFSTSNHR